MASVISWSVLREASSVLRLSARLKAHQAWDRLGISSVLIPSALLACAALAICDGVNQRAIALLAMQAGQAPAGPQPPTHVGAMKASDNATQARDWQAGFERGLPSHDYVGDVLATIVKLAEARHIQLAHGEYREQLDDTGAFSSYGMVFPVVAEPSAIQGFVADVLHAEPYLALGHLHVQRDAANPAQTDVRLEFVLFTRPAVAPVLAAGGQT